MLHVVMFTSYWVVRLRHTRARDRMFT